ncbi:hypothetical protein B0H13DRAFT_2061884, partial [Mycena leptocephala]
MAAMLYLYVCFYSMGWACCRGSTVPTSSPPGCDTGMAMASGSQWLWNFVQKIFFKFATINIGATVTFSLSSRRSLEDMDIIFGSTTQEARTAHIAARETELDHEVHGDTHHDD